MFCFADDTDKTNSLENEDETSDSYQQALAKVGTRENKGKREASLTGVPELTALLRILGNWPHRETDNIKRWQSGAAAQALLATFARTAFDTTRIRVRALNLLTSKMTFGCETRLWSSAEKGVIGRSVV